MEMTHRVLFLHPGPVPPSADPRRNALYQLSRCCEGDLVTTRWRVRQDDRPGPSTGLFDTLGAFGYHATRSTKVRGPLKAAWNLAYFVGKGLALSRDGGRYDAIVAYGPYTTGLAALIVGRLTGAKVIIDVPGRLVQPFDLYPGALARLKGRVARVLVPAVLRRADAIKLLYPGQLDDLGTLRLPPAEVFHNFTPISAIRPLAGGDGRYVLFLGYPWFLKGVDLLIRAFNAICDKHPDIELKVVGHCPDRAPFEALAGGNPRISFHRAMPHERAMELMAGCTAFVLPSRTEAMGRVLLEAMAARKPIVASRVDGIPTYIQHGENGLLFEPGDAGDLAAQLDTLLGDPGYADRLASEGHRRVFRDYSEDRYVENYRDLLGRVVGPPSHRREREAAGPGGVGARADA